jgi:hypothetical protein
MKTTIATLGALFAVALVGVATPAAAGEYRSSGNDCYKCPPPRNYDSQEVIKNSKDIDHTAEINTTSVVPSKRLIETNHLIIRENETRNIGTIQHNHTIIEKELILRKNNVDTKNVNTVVNLVEHKYNTERKHIVEEREIPGEIRTLPDCNCETGRGGYRSSRAIEAYGMAPKYVSSRR